MKNKLLVGTIVVFIVMSLVDMFVNGVLLRSIYQETAKLWRPEGEMKMGLFFVVYAFISFFFTLIFSKGYEGKGVIEGVRYGFYVGMMMSVPMAYGTFAVMDIPYSLAMQWFIYGVIEYIILGVTVALVYGKKSGVVAS